MTSSPALRRVLLVIALLLLLGLAWTGLYGGTKLLSPSHTLGQKVQAYAQIAFGLFALLSGVTTFRAHRWSSLAQACFTITLAMATGLFAVVWNRMTLVLGIVSGTTALLAALAIIGLLRVGARGLTSA